MNRTYSQILNDGEHLEVLLQDINNGSKTSALLMVNELKKRLIKNPSSIPKSVREWLADCLTDIACNDVTGKKALGLTGQTKLWNPHHSIHLTVAQVHQFIKDKSLPLHKSETSPSAFADAGAEFNISTSNAEKYYYFAEKHYPSLDDDFLRDIVGLTDDEIEHEKNKGDYPIANRI